MKNYDPQSFVRHLAVIFTLLCIFAISPSHALPGGSPALRKHNELDTGYSALRLFLRDERYLTIIRRTKAVLMFEGISEPSKKLIDDISDASTTAMEQLEYFASAKPAILMQDFAEDSIAMTTLDAMRMTTAKEFFFGSDDFEKNLLVSQAQILRVISHLARTMVQHEPNRKRRAWLSDLADRYEHYYRKVYARLLITH